MFFHIMLVDFGWVVLCRDDWCVCGQGLAGRRVQLPVLVCYLPHCILESECHPGTNRSEMTPVRRVKTLQSDCVVLQHVY